MDFYKVLELERSASLDEIKTAYRKKAFESHPDRNPGDKESEKRFKEVQLAYDTLSDPAKKANYDGTGTPFSAMWDSIFNKATPQFERGRDSQITIELELLDVLNGITKTILVPKKERCNKCNATGFTEYKTCIQCHGSGKIGMKQGTISFWSSCGYCNGSGKAGTVKCDECKSNGFLTLSNFEASITIPPGVETGHRVRAQDYGEPSRQANGKNGDLYIIIIVKDHRLFKRHGVNLSYEFPVGFSDLCLGTKVDIPTLTGVASLTIPPKTQDYTQFRLTGLGLPYFHGGKGDLIVVVKLMTPATEVIESNKELIEKFGEFEKNYLLEERNKLK